MQHSEVCESANNPGLNHFGFIIIILLAKTDFFNKDKFIASILLKYILACKQISTIFFTETHNYMQLVINSKHEVNVNTLASLEQDNFFW